MSSLPNFSRLSSNDHQPPALNLFWLPGRIVVLGAVIFVVWLLIAQPNIGLTVVWKLVVPALPMIFALAPGLWRIVCPMALMNRIPGKLGVSLGLGLSDRWRNWAIVVALALFLGPVALRQPLLNDNGVAVAAMLAAAMTAALLGGVVFARRSGWCGTFCPLGPIEKAYGLAPYFKVRSGYCTTCIGCQKNCQDRVPKAAILADLADEDPWHGRWWKFFIAGLPGLMVGYFTSRDPDLVGFFPYLSVIVAWPLFTVALFFLVRAIAGMSDLQLAMIFSMTALAVFYWFAWPVILIGLHEVFGITSANWIVRLGQFTALVICASILVRTIGIEKARLEAL